jgi:alkylhydroperoxidase/carboxymuconolactone decarboxylase family protein YurZ
MDKRKKGEDVLEKIRKDRGEAAAAAPIFQQWAARDPIYLELYHNTFMHIMQTGTALEPKIKKLIILSVEAAEQFIEGVGRNTVSALAAGATEEEVIEALAVASIPGGIHTFITCLPIIEKAFQEYRRRKG